MTRVTGPMRPVTGNRKVARFPGNDVPFVKLGLLITKMFAFGMKMDEQALEPGTDEIRGKHGTGH